MTEKSNQKTMQSCCAKKIAGEFRRTLYLSPFMHSKKKDNYDVHIRPKGVVTVVLLKKEVAAVNLTVTAKTTNLRKIKTL